MVDGSDTVHVGLIKVVKVIKCYLEGINKGIRKYTEAYNLSTNYKRLWAQNGKKRYNRINKKV